MPRKTNLSAARVALRFHPQETAKQVILHVNLQEHVRKLVRQAKDLADEPIGAGQRRVQLRADLEGRVRAMVVQFFAIVLQILQFFGGLVLGCTKTKFCKKLCI